MAAVQTIYDRFRVRGGTAAALAARNEVPLVRELCVEIDTRKIKVGDGVTAYNSLPYMFGDLDLQFRVNGGWIQFSVDEGATWENLVALADLKGDPGDPGPIGPPGPSSSCFPTASFSGGGGQIAVGTKCVLPVPFGFAIAGWRLDALQTGTLQLDVLLNGVSIVGAAAPTLSSANHAEDDTLSGWTTTVANGDRLTFIVTACSGINEAALVLKGVRS